MPAAEVVPVVYRGAGLNKEFFPFIPLISSPWRTDDEEAKTKKYNMWRPAQELPSINILQ
jgi:hypothetical protein